MRPHRPRSYFWPLHLWGWAALALAMAVGRVGERSLAVIVVTEPVFAAWEPSSRRRCASSTFASGWAGRGLS